jgi:hypothetical protein
MGVCLKFGDDDMRLADVKLCHILDQQDALLFGDGVANRPKSVRVPTLLNAESRGIDGRFYFRWSRWQGEVERRATPAVAVGPDPAAMRFDDRLANCQTHATAL